MPEGGIVQPEIRIGDSIVYVTDEDDAAVRRGTSDRRRPRDHVARDQRPDVDELWERAAGAGCEVVFPLADQFYGDRGGRVRDPFRPPVDAQHARRGRERRGARAPQQGVVGENG
jgi:PhnB protein